MAESSKTWHCLKKALYSAAHETVLMILDKVPQLVNLNESEENRTAWHYLAMGPCHPTERGRIAKEILLPRIGGELSMLDQKDHSALFYAVSQQHEILVKHFISNLRERYGIDTPFVSCAY